MYYPVSLYYIFLDESELFPGFAAQSCLRTRRGWGGKQKNDIMETRFK